MSQKSGLCVVCLEDSCKVGGSLDSGLGMDCYGQVAKIFFKKLREQGEGRHKWWKHEANETWEIIRETMESVCIGVCESCGLELKGLLDIDGGLENVVQGKNLKDLEEGLVYSAVCIQKMMTINGELELCEYLAGKRKPGVVPWEHVLIEWTRIMLLTTIAGDMKGDKEGDGEVTMEVVERRKSKEDDRAVPGSSMGSKWKPVGEMVEGE